MRSIIKSFTLISIVLLCFLALVSCEKTIPMHWVTTEEGYSVWCVDEQNVSYSWNGSTFSNLINGSGQLTISYVDGSSKTVPANAFYGALSKDDAIKSSSDEYYIGAVSDNKYSGFAALIKGNDIYVGDFYEGKPSGSLSLYRNGRVFYVGSWSDGAFDGEGTLYGQDGSIKSGIWEKGTLISAEVEIETDAGKYEGLVQNGKPNGFGKLSYRNGAEYEGNWKDGEWDGIGQYVFQKDTLLSEWTRGKANGSTILVAGNYQYEGQYAGDLPNGNGSYYCLDSTATYMYAGEWLNGKRSGYGDAIFQNGDSYFGEWKDDLYNGIGRYRYANGDVYDGEWTNNLPNGQGQYISQEFKYGGEWLEGWIHGFGRIDFANGDIYEGDFCEGKKCGYGLYQYANGNVYEGEFYDDKINGLGVFTFADGNWYEGEFLNGKIQGNGTLYYSDSTGVVTLTAFWDKPNEFPSQASIIFPNGDCYEGPLVNGEPTAEGTWYVLDSNGEKSKVIDRLSSINDYYKQHRETFNKVVIYTSLALTAVEIAATAAIPLTGGASAIIATSAHFANTGLNALDIAMAAGSASLDLATADTDEEKAEAAIDLGAEVAINGALLLLPKALQAGPVKKITSKLSSSATSLARSSLIKFSKNKAVAKVVRVVKNKEKKLILSLEKSAIGRKYFRATAKANYQYVTNEQVQRVIKNNPNVKVPEYNPNAAGSGKVLGDNALQFMSEKARRRYNAERRIMGQRRAQWHHAIAGNKSNAAAEECRSILKKYRIDINDPRNAILLPVEPKSIMRGTIHGKHVNNYDEYVLNRLKQAATPEQCLEVMDDIKRELYKGQLQLLTEHRVNTAIRTVTRESMY